MMKMSNNKGNFFINLFIIISIIAIVLIIISTFIFPILGIISSAFGDIATIISVILAVISILYTYISGEKTLKNLNEISKQSQNLVNQIIRERSKDNFDYENVNNVLNEDMD
ncbi:MAG: hypothetical protein ACI4F6_08595 [Acutalibacteraceae bacterium]